MTDYEKIKQLKDYILLISENVENIRTKIDELNYIIDIADEIFINEKLLDSINEHKKNINDMSTKNKKLRGRPKKEKNIIDKDTDLNIENLNLEV
jgi:hypothetical protein